MAFLFSLSILLFFFLTSVLAQAPVEDPHAHHMHHDHSHHDGMRMDMDGAVMNENVDQLPRDCPSIAGEQTITVHAGKKYAAGFAGTIFGYDQQEWHVPPCSKVTITFVNEDHVRHQWMIHGLPRYLYPEGMFHLEVNGQVSKTGTFIVPSAKKTYLVHCDIAQHMEKGMKAQLKVGGGSGDLPSIPGVSNPRLTERYRVQWERGAVALMIVSGLLGVGGSLLTWRRS